MSHTAARISIACVGLHVMAFGVLHVLEPSLSPTSTIISDYMATERRAIATTSFLAFALLWLSLALALGDAGESMLVRVGRGLLVMGSIFIVVGIVVPSSMDPRTGSALSTFQNLFSRPGLFLGVLLISVGLSRTDGWRERGRVLTVLAVSAFALLVSTIAVLLGQGLGGVGQRLVFLTLYAWSLLVARGILMSSAERTDAT